MAGDWIKMRSNLWDDPRVARLCDLTEQAEAPIVGALYWLWAMADQHTEDGILPGLTLRQIDRKTGIPGFGQALCEIGWLEEVQGGLRIVRFDEHNGSSAKKRAQTARRVAEHRSGNDVVTPADQSSNAQVTQPALQNCDDGVTGALAREREEKEKRETSPPGGREMATELSIAMRKAGVQCQPADPRLLALAAQGVTAETAVAACDEAKRSKQGERINLGYVVAILERWAKEAADLHAKGASPKAKGGWWLSPESKLAKALEVGAGPPRPGESEDQWDARIRTCIDNGGKPPVPKSAPVVSVSQTELQRLAANQTQEGIEAGRASMKAALRGVSP